jgi:hypothetical protein
MMPNPTLHEFQAFLASVIDEDFALATNHPYDCTCDRCRHWWIQMGPEDGGAFGPFGDDLWSEFAEALDVSVEEAKRMHGREVEKDA